MKRTIFTADDKLTFEMTEAVLADAYDREQRQLESRTALPGEGQPETARSADSNRLIIAGSVALGMFIACIVLLTVFVVLNMIFHANL
jgi:hypothetical protein